MLEAEARFFRQPSQRTSNTSAQGPSSPYAPSKSWYEPWREVKILEWGGKEWQNGKFRPLLYPTSSMLIGQSHRNFQNVLNSSLIGWRPILRTLIGQKNSREFFSSSLIGCNEFQNKMESRIPWNWVFWKLFILLIFYMKDIIFTLDSANKAWIGT